MATVEKALAAALAGTAAAAGQSPSAPGTPGGISPTACDVSGQRLPGISKWSFSFGGEYNVPVGSKGGEAYVGYDGNYRSRFSSNPSPSAYTWIEGYSLSNVRAGYRVALAARRHGLVIRPLGDSILFVPPISIQADEVKHLVTTDHRATQPRAQSRHHGGVAIGGFGQCAQTSGSRKPSHIKVVFGGKGAARQG